MKKTIYILTLLILSTNVFSQEILTSLHNNNKAEVRDDIFVEEIESEIIFYGKFDNTYKKNISKYNSTNRLISEIGYDKNGLLLNCYFIEYDSTNTKKTLIKIQRKNSTYYKNYEYDNKGFLIKISEMNANKDVIVSIEFKNNNEGYPLESLTNNYVSNSLDKETAEYYMDNNLVIISTVNSNGGIREYANKINKLKKDPEDKINNQGDIIKTENTEYEYKYDKLNNWIEKTEFKIINGIRQKYSTIKRKIKYKK